MLIFYWHDFSMLSINKMAATFPSDQSFIAALRDRNISAANHFYDHYAPTLFKVIICHAKSEKQAQKILEKTMLCIWDNLEEFEAQDQRLLIWMSGIARKKALADKSLPKTMKIFKFKNIGFSASDLPAWLSLPLSKKPF
jgi:hypothetical protein